MYAERLNKSTYKCFNCYIYSVGPAESLYAQVIESWLPTADSEAEKGVTGTKRGAGGRILPGPCENSSGYLLSKQRNMAMLILIR
jgi:hypothetical protein